MTSFDAVASIYDSARPGYPAAVFDALGPLAGARVLDVGAGTGLATRDLHRRGAEVVAVDVGLEMLRVATARTETYPAVVADGATLPFADACADLVCFAQSWHWLAPARRTGEAARVLRRGGRWAAWWSHVRADGEPWFDATWDAIEAACPGVDRSQRDPDWGDEPRLSGRFTVTGPTVLPWTRRITVEQWINDCASQSFVFAMEPAARDALLAEIGGLARDAFPSAPMLVPYDTRLWIATVG